MKTPNRIFSGMYAGGHVQGIAVDCRRGYVYYSFTTMLLKTDLEGKPLGSVRNLAGHLGCITYDACRDRLYGSLELKHDVIGRDITQVTGRELSQEDAFYLVSFDVARIDRMDMDAESDGVMRAVYLRDVVADYGSIDPVSGKLHRYGCSGIDGIALGPAFGEAADSPCKIMIAYGIYGEVDRGDNDHQVILQLDPDVLDIYAKALNQTKPHHSGPDGCEQRYFFYTGNTLYGIQNLEYDPFSRTWLAAVYRGEKPQFANFRLFAIDARQKPRMQLLTGRQEQGMVLTSAKLGQEDNGIYGSMFPYGATGIYSLGNGTFYFSENGYDKEKKLFYTHLQAYRLESDALALFMKLEEEA